MTSTTTLLTRSYSDSELFISYLPYDYQCSNEWIYNSWPQLNWNHDPSPPNYHQICVADFISFNNLERHQQLFSQSSHRFSKSFSLIKHENTASWSKRLNEEIDTVRRENFLLMSTVLKNNADIKLLMAKHQLVANSVNELNSEIRKIEKKNHDLEEKLHLNNKEIKLIYDDLKQLKKDFLKLHNNISSNIVDSTPASPNVQSNSHQSGIDFSSSSSSCSYGETSIINNDIHLIHQRIEQLESKIRKMVNLNSDVCDQLNKCIKGFTLEEDIGKKLEQRFQYMNDMNQLLQLKIHMVESKVDHQTYTSTSAHSNDSLQPYQNTNHLTKAFDNSVTLSTIGNSNKSFQTNKPIIQNSPIAYVSPNVRNNPNQQQLTIQQQNDIPSIMGVQRSLSIESNPVDQLTENEHSSRRCRRNHRIRLFPHRRRH